MAERSTRIRYDRPSDFAKFFANAAIAAVTPLDTITKFPPFGPGKIRMKCLTSGKVIVTLEDGSDFELNMLAGESELIETTVKAFKSVTGGTFEARAYWWYVPQALEFQYKPNLNL